MDETKAIQASDIVKAPDEVLGLMQHYILVRDQSVFRSSFENMIQALNILADYGWEPVQMFYADGSSVMFALIENTNYKRKNETEE